MKRIKLIVTGDMERQALHLSLAKAFPNVREHEDVIWDVPQRLHCTTSYRLRAGEAPSRGMVALASAMIAEAGIGKRGDPADLVVVIDDAELGNSDQPQVVADLFKAAVEQVLDRYEPGTQERYRAILRERCSFHVLMPMVEAYLFGDRSALEIAGVPQATPIMLLHPTDIEEFETNDPAWLPSCALENPKRQRAAPWWRHERHPKHYLEHLLERGDIFYEETEHGRRALEDLLWRDVPKVGDDVSIVRCLFEDIADWYGIVNPLGDGERHPSFYPSRSIKRERLLLRNM